MSTTPTKLTLQQQINREVGLATSLSLSSLLSLPRGERERERERERESERERSNSGNVRSLLTTMSLALRKALTVHTIWVWLAWWETPYLCCCGRHTEKWGQSSRQNPPPPPRTRADTSHLMQRMAAAGTLTGSIKIYTLYLGVRLRKSKVFDNCFHREIGIGGLILYTL